MAPLIVEPSATATWHRLITDAAGRAATDLDEDSESYLVFLLMRYLRRPRVVRAVLALEFLEGLRQSRSLRRNRLQEVGDQCLLFTGLFPEQAARRRVRLSYFVAIGQTAYGEVADSSDRGTRTLFRQLATTFVGLSDVLRAVRDREGEPLMSALEAAERSLELDSGLARGCLAERTGATLIDAGERRH
ncbi:MAG TPA: hypothetical protein VKA32_07190 [Gammaproteobacteria bacterium]|nr:hypothetical protein [Gammaproteobacteria bacterium]